MSRVRTLGGVLLIAVLAVGASACSDDDKKTESSDRPAISFADPPEGSTDLGLCYAYDIDQMKELIGGDETFKRLAPAAIGVEGDDVTGDACSWQRIEPNGDSLNLRIEARDYGEDTATLATQFAAMRDGDDIAEAVPDIGDEAYVSITDESSVMQVQDGQYLLTISSRAEGGLEPVNADALTLLAATGLAQLP